MDLEDSTTRRREVKKNEKINYHNFDVLHFLILLLRQKESYNS